MEFIKNLYNSDNFTLYLTIALIVLVILFFVVLIFGKKDQLEETKRLQKIETDDAFKKEEKEPVKVEVKEEKEEEKKVHVIVFEPDKSNSKSLPKEEEEENLVLPEASLDEISLSIAEGINNLENIKKEFSSIEIPEIDNKEEKEKEFTPSEVFSSVYVKDEPKVTVEEPKKIEKPILINQENNANDEDDDEFALPELASDDKK